MKRSCVSLLSLIILCFSIKYSYAYESSLSSLSIGVAGFVNNYQPAWGSQYDELESGYGTESGMFLATGSGKWLLSFLFMTSYFGSTGDLDFQKDVTSYNKSVNTSMERTDIDLILQYNITDNLKLFAGGKLFYLLLESPVVDINGTKQTVESSDENPCEYGGYGLGAGISYSFFLFSYNNLVFHAQPSLSYVMLWGEATESFVFVTDFDPEKIMNDYSSTQYTAKGFNGTANLMMTVVLNKNSSGEGTFFTVACGYRYQFLRYTSSDSSIEMGDEIHQGVMLTGMFTLKYYSQTGCCL